MNKLVAFIALLCAAAFAQKPDINWFAKNSEANVFHISTANELAGLVTLVNNTAGVGQPMNFSGKTIVLANDINLSAYGANYNAKKGWIPIGGERFPFSGIFDGDGKKITGLYINNGFGSVGLFGYIKDGIVKNMSIENINVTGSGAVGGILGNGENTKIINSYSTGKVTNTGSFKYNCNHYGTCKYSSLGGIVGDLKGSIVDSYSSAVVKGQGDVGGVVGNLKGNIANSYSTSTISGNNFVGGVVGNLEGKVENCYSIGAINGDNFVGGVAGYGGNILNSYSTNEINGNDNVGGVIGHARSGDILNNYSTGTVKGNKNVGGVAGSTFSGYTYVDYSYSTGIINGKYNVGGIVGELSGPSVKNSYSTGTISGTDNIGGITGIVSSYSSGIYNCYSTSAVSGNSNVGGIAGLVSTHSSSGIYNSAALNQSVKTTGASFGRIVGTLNEKYGKLSKNVAFKGMMNNIGNTLWLNKGAENINGADISNAKINIDGTIGNKFTDKAGWKVEEGKLPGIVTAVDMPKHLQVDVTAIEEERINNPSSITDKRDGKKYRVVKIGTQTWIAENLNYKANGSKCFGEGGKSGGSRMRAVEWNVSAKKLTDKQVQDNCEKYGQLYDWATAMKVCPSGWHLPNNIEWDALYRFVDGNNDTESPYKSTTAGKDLREINDKMNSGTDKYDFSALPSGYGNSEGNFFDIDIYSFWWSTSEDNDSEAYHRDITNNNDIANWGKSDKKKFYSVRCLRDEGYEEAKSVGENETAATVESVSE